MGKVLRFIDTMENKAMNNQPFFSNNSPSMSPTAFDNSSPEPTKKPTKKIILISAGILALAIVVVIGIIVFHHLSGDTFSDDPKVSLQNTSSSKYITLENYEDIQFNDLSDDQEQELQDTITTFFSNMFPKFTSMTVSNSNDAKTTVENEATEEENIEEKSTTSFVLTSNTKEQFLVTVEISSNVYGYSLSINDSNNKEIFSQFKNTDFNSIDPYKPNEQNFIEAISYKLPFSSETDNGIKFDVAYEGDGEDRLTISATDEASSLSDSDCENAKQKTVDWINNLDINYSETISAANLICAE